MVKVLETRSSIEKCTESGWLAYDFMLSHALEEEDILALKPLGNFVYLKQLKKPFFKIESDHFHIKGMKGNAYIRVAVHGAYLDKVKNIQNFIDTQAEVF